MKLSETGELSLLSLLERRFGRKVKNVVRGVGDDAAVVSPPKGNSLLTTDMMVEKVHFDLRWTTPFQLGHKLVTRNVSDIFAMAGRPDFLLINFAGPRSLDLDFFKRFFDGVKAASRHYRVALVGGDISRADKVTVSATVFGHAARPIYRNSARVGDLVQVSGTLGDAACGLEVLRRIKKPVDPVRRKDTGCPASWSGALPLLRRHLMPEARDAKAYARGATAMIDISDGLLIDLSRLCKASGVGAVVFIEGIPLSPHLIKTAKRLGVSAVDLALGGGDDYEILFTAREPHPEAVTIGEIVPHGLSLVDRNGKAQKVKGRGYQHFTV